jgi:hypothetical protein
MPHRCDAKRHRRAMEGYNPLATVGRADEDERIAEVECANRVYIYQPLENGLSQASQRRTVPSG